MRIFLLVTSLEQVNDESCNANDATVELVATGFGQILLRSKNNARNGEGTSTWIFSCCGGIFVDGSEIRPSPVDMVNIPLFTTGFIHVRWLALGFLNHQQLYPNKKLSGFSESEKDT